MCQGQSTPSQQPAGWVLLSPPLKEEEIEAQQGEVICPESHSQEMAWGTEHKSGWVGKGEGV